LAAKIFGNFVPLQIQSDIKTVKLVPKILASETSRPVS